MSTRTSPQRRSSRSPDRSPRSTEAGLPASAKRRRVGTTPRRAVAHDEHRRSVGRDLGDATVNDVGSSPGKDRGTATASGRKGGRKSGRLANRVETPRGMLKQLANELPPPTPNLASSSSEEEAPPSPEKPNRSPPGPAPASARSARTRASPVSPAGRDELRSDDDVFAQLVPDRRPTSLSSVHSPSRTSRTGLRGSLGRVASPGGPLGADGAEEDTFERAVRQDASRRRIETAAGKRQSGASEVESQMGRGRLSSVGARTSLGADVHEDHDGGAIGVGRDSGRFIAGSDRIFRASASPAKSPLGLPLHLSSPIRTQQTLSALSSPGAEEDTSAAEMDIDIPLDDDLPLLESPSAATRSISATARLGARSSAKLVMAREASMSLDGDMDMDLGTEDDDEPSPLLEAAQEPVTLQDEAREATPALGAPPSPAPTSAGVGPEEDEEMGLGAPEADVSAGTDEIARPPDSRQASSSPQQQKAREAATTEARRKLSAVLAAAEPEDREFRPDEMPEEEAEGDDVIDLGLLDDLPPKPKPKTRRGEVPAPSTSRRRRRPQRYTATGLPVPELPRGLVKDLFAHFAGGGSTKLATDGLDGIMDASHSFLSGFMADCASVAGSGKGQRGGKTRVSEADAVEVLKGMGLLNEKTTLQSLGRRFGVPKEVQGVLDGIRTEGKRKGKAVARRRKKEEVEEEEAVDEEDEDDE